MGLTIDQAIQKAVEAHKTGQIQEADRLYTAILKAQPKHPDANHNMGVLAVSVGKVDAALPFFKTALEVNPSIAQFWLSYTDALIKLNRLTDAAAVLDQAKSKGAKGDGFDKLEKRLVATPGGNDSDGLDPPQAQLQELINLYTRGQLQQVLKQAETLFKRFPQSAILLNIQGAVLKGLGKLEDSVAAYTNAVVINPGYAEACYNMGNALKDQGKLKEAIQAYRKALTIKPDYAEALNNMGVSLQDQGRLKEAIQAYKKALTIKPDYAYAYSNMGSALKDQGKLKEAIKAYNKSLAIKPENAEAYNNMGNAFKEQDKLEEAIEAYKKALTIKPEYAYAYSNMGNALKDQGKLKEAIKAYNKALAIMPDFAEAHRHLSALTKYTADTSQISNVEALLQQIDLSDSDRCHLHYTYAKMQEDLGNLSAAHASYVAGGKLRQKLLAYQFSQDEHFFGRIKQTAPQFKDVALNLTNEAIRYIPIFILGMPRSGTTLVEQIVSSHSEITGAGELEYISRYGKKLAAGLTSPTLGALSAFRKIYLAELANRADGRAFITDKMPQNFRFIALICAAFPEAKIIHVQRSAEAICWSNFKHYFNSKGLGYSCDLGDTVKYFNLYKDLMQSWSLTYSERIYNLNYDKLTEDQTLETRRLIDYLGIKWEDACLTPQNNKRPVSTSSQQQVRQKVYKGSSQAWRKYHSYIGTVFDNLH